ncbi:MAG: DNA polymerase III subunit gamma/tau [Actinomycetota bacterium]
MAYEALYRRYRPSTFEDAFFGQDHVKAALINAVDGDRVGHAYLFSGPRGTGKTTSARILAKALNCTNLQGGEPCNECDSCLAFNSGSSYDLHELDAASNNGVDAMRDLIGKVALGSPGRTKVYILDEVHMLSSGAENALLKTLEEPPPHVVFVLCTTEPNKVVPTIRSRTQHLEFSLLNQSEVGELVDHVVTDAGLEITGEDRSYVIRAGGGSARDTLSALDQVVAAGGAPRGGEHLDALFGALVERDGAAGLAAIDGAMQAGRDPATIATALLSELRSVFLATMRADLSHLPDAGRERAESVASAMPPARVTRAIEVLGAAIVEMRQAPDPRVDLEVAVMRLTRTDLDITPEALLERIEVLEAGAPAAAPAQPAASPAASVPASESPAASVPAQPAPSQAPPAVAPPAQAQPAAPPSAGKRGADMVRAALAEQRAARGEETAPAEPAPARVAETTAAEAPPAPAAESGGSPRTLADRQRQRRAAAEGASTEGASTEGASTQAPPTTEAAAPGSASTAAATPVDAGPNPSEPADVAMPAADASGSVAQPAPAPTDPARSEPQPVSAPTEPAAAPAPDSEAESTAADPAPSGGGSLPLLGELQGIWPGLLETLSGRVRSRFAAGEFMPHDGGSAIFGLPNPVHRDRCEEVRGEVDEALATKFGAPVPLKLEVDTSEPEPDIFASPPVEPTTSSGAPEAPVIDHDDEAVDLDGLVDAGADAEPTTGVDMVLSTFEGSKLLEDPSSGDPDER